MADNDSRNEQDSKAAWEGEKPAAAPAAGAKRKPGWEHQLVTKLATAALLEQRRARRWGIFFKVLGFAYVGFTLFMIWQAMDFERPGPEAARHTAMVNVEGVIAAGENASAANVIAGLQAAFNDSKTAGVILTINSPGGSPVQSGAIYDEIRRLREQHPDTPLYAVLGDVCASGGYYVASAADRIFADKASIVGSIGVRMDGFGFVDAMKHLGVERRLLTAGENKALLDPFSPAVPEEQEHIQALLNEIHQQFIDAVRTGRGDRLGNDPALFSGLVWTGEQARQKGLVDAIGSERYVAREVIGETEVVNFTPREGLVERFADRIGAAMFHLLSDRLTPQLQP